MFDIISFVNATKKRLGTMYIIILAPGRAVRSTPQRRTFSFKKRHQFTALYGVLASIPGAGLLWFLGCKSALSFVTVLF